MSTIVRRSSGRIPLPRWNSRKGWMGGEPNRLYAFTCRQTGIVKIRPVYDTGSGPECDVRPATRAEAERDWQSPLNPGWKVT